VSIGVPDIFYGEEITINEQVNEVGAKDILNPYTNSKKIHRSHTARGIKVSELAQ
jgi:hypothetical protein